MCTSRPASSFAPSFNAVGCLEDLPPGRFIPGIEQPAGRSGTGRCRLWARVVVRCGGQRRDSAMRKFVTAAGAAELTCEYCGWRDGIPATLHEEDLPACVREVIAASRAARPDRVVTCVSLRTLEGGRETARLGLDAELIPEEGVPSILSRLRPKDLLVLSVSVTETTFEAVRTVTYVLIARTAPAPTHLQPSAI